MLAFAGVAGMVYSKDTCQGKTWYISPSTQANKTCHGKLAKEKLGIFLRPHKQIKLVMENLSRWKLVRVHSVNCINGEKVRIVVQETSIPGS